MAKRVQKQTDRANLDNECLQRLHEIIRMIKAATLDGTVAILPQNEDYPENYKYNLLEIKQTRNTNKPRKSDKISKSTLYRDLALLRQNQKDGGFECPIAFDYSKKGYYLTDPSYELVSDSSSPENLIALATAKIILSNLSNNTPVYKKISEITNQITNNTDLTKRISIAPHPTAKLKIETWSLISTSISENRKLLITYQGYDRKNKKEIKTDILFSPFQLIFDEQTYYLYGQIEFKVPFGKTFFFSSYSDSYFLYGNKSPEEERAFYTVINCSLISEIKLTENTFELPETFDSTKTNLKQIFGYRDCIFDQKLLNTNKTAIQINDKILPKYKEQTAVSRKTENKITIKLYKDALHLFTNCSFSEDQEIIAEHPDEDSITVSFTPQFPDVLKFILSLGSNVLPIAPAQLVRSWKYEIIKAYKKFITDDDLKDYNKTSNDIDFISSLKK